MAEIQSIGGMDSLSIHERTVQDLSSTIKNTTTVSTTELLSTESTTESETPTTFTKDQHVTVIRETIVYSRGKLISDISHVDSHYIDSMSIDRFLDYIERQRLTHMPHRGSKWDNVLKWAEFYALQVGGYAKAVQPFVPDSKDAAKLIWASCRSLLELGPENSDALATTFAVFYKLGLSVSFFLRHNHLLHVTAHIRLEVAQALNDMLKLVRDVSLHYQLKSYATTTQHVHLDFYSVFGDHTERFNRRKDHIIRAMWQHQIGDEAASDVHTLQKWLTPEDPVLHTIMEDSKTRRGAHAEYTCQWFQRPLLDFTRSGDDILEVVGPSGFGKSVLFGWTIERLQRPLGKRVHQTLTFRFEADIPKQCTGVAMAKSLALQLLENNVGDKDLFNSLFKTYSRSCETKGNDHLEEELWDSLETALRSSVAQNDNYMIVIDGLDQIKDGKPAAQKVHRHLSALTSKCSNLQSIIFSRESSSPTKGQKSKVFTITKDHTHEDMRIVAENMLSRCVHFKEQNEFTEEAIVQQLVQLASGNFLWVLLVASSLARESSHSAFVNALKKLKDSVKTVSELIQHNLSTVDFTTPSTRLLLSWLLVTERPLRVTEIKCLMQVDLQSKRLSERKTDIKSDIMAICGSLVSIENEVVRLSNSAVRTQLLKLQSEGKKLLTAEAAQADLTSRLLAYCKFVLTSDFDLIFELGNLTDADDLFKSHILLEYATRNWSVHYRAASISKGLSNSADFKAIFPSSPRLAILEWICWGSQPSMSRAVDRHTFALSIREAIFGEKHECVIQNLVLCGDLHKKLSNTTEAGTCFYRASMIGQSVLREFSTFTRACTTTFLSITESFTTTTRTELVTRREVMLKYIIHASKHQHGKTSDIVIRYCKVLAELYVSIHEEEKAETIWRELREIIIIRHGKGSEEERGISENLTICLKKSKKQEEIVEYEKCILEIATSLEVWDEHRIKILLELALSYESRSEFFFAEEIYIKIWRKLIEESTHHHHHFGIEVHIHIIDVVLEYVRFLQRRHRHEEACSMLICIWTSYEEFDFESETLFLRLKIIGECMRTLGLFTLAISVFRKCLTWFSLRGHHEHREICETLITEVTEEIHVKTISTTTTTTTTTKTTETVIKESFESVIKRSTVTSETISVCKSLIAHHMKLEQWSAAIEVTTRTLTLVWKMILSGGGTCALPRDFSEEAIEMGISLAICHYRSHHFHEAEQIYLRVFRACRNSCHVHDKRMTRAYKVLVEFYESHKLWHKVIEIHKELLVEYRKHFGASHEMTLHVLRTLGSLCLEHGHGHAVEYYEEIVLVINGDAKFCRAGALDAMTILCRIYHEEGHWHKAKRTCEVLWETWVHHHHEHKFEAEFIEILYARYCYVLERHFSCEYELLRSITISYKDICVKYFGAHVDITIRAILEYAHICMRSEKHFHEAITHYEKVLTITTTTTTTTKTVVSTETVVNIKKRLVEAYSVVCSHESTSVTMIERAIKIIHEHWELTKVKFGCAHMESLGHFRKMILLYLRIKTHESITVMKRLLVDTVVEIITKEKHSKTLNEAARFLGQIFLSCDLVEYGLSMLSEIRRQIMTGTNSPKDGFSFKLNHTVGRVCFVFLVTFQESLECKATSRYSILMAELLTETFLYERYTQCIKSTKKIEETLVAAAQLRLFLIHHHRTGQIKPLEEHVFEMFLEKWSGAVKMRREITFIFYIAFMEELAVEGRGVGLAACISSISKVRHLLEKGKYNDAVEVASCAFHFLHHQRFYHDITHVGYTFKLSSLLALRDITTPPKEPVDTKVRAQMLELSRSIIREVFKACKEANINFVRLQLHELSDLVGLLGDQENTTDLEWLLELLWSSREVQKSWSSTTIIAIGSRLVQAKFLSNKKPEATRLCEDICYNLRSLWGQLHPLTLDMSDLLCQLYTSAGHFRESMGVHENILRLITEGDDEDDRTVDEVDAAVARKHIDHLRQSYVRLGGWDKSATMYGRLVEDLLAMPKYRNKTEFQGVQNPSKWSLKETTDESDKFSAPRDWEFERAGEAGEPLHGGTPCGHGASPITSPVPVIRKRPRMGVKRSSSNWGIGLIHRFLHGEDDEEEQPVVAYNSTN